MYLKYGPARFNSDATWQSYVQLPEAVLRPLLNGQPIFLAGWLDQSYWPDGIYTAPTDEALAFDVQAVAEFGLNTIRLHQKVNPERWYYAADQLGVMVMQVRLAEQAPCTAWRRADVSALRCAARSLHRMRCKSTATRPVARFPSSRPTWWR